MTSMLGAYHSSAPSRWYRPVRQRATVVGLSAAALTLISACSSGGKPASAPLPPRQALLAAAAQTQRITSATETLTVRTSGASNSAMTGTIQARLKPTLMVSGNLDATEAGTSSRIKMIITGTAMYFSEAALTSQVGKPWVKIDLSTLDTLAGTTGSGLTQLFHSLESNNFASQARLSAVARNARVVGKQAIDGVSTTEYAGSFTAAAGLKALPADLRKALAPGLRAMGNSTISFREWVDGQHHVRKLAEVETVNGNTVHTSINVTAINQPVTITLPPASQTFTLPDSTPVSGQSGNGGLGANIVPAPSGFTPAGAQNGPVNASEFNQIIGGGDPAAGLHFVRGYNVTYNSTSNNDRIVVFLFQFATPADATVFKADSLSVAPGKPKADLFIPGAEDYDATSPSQGMYDHGVIGIKGNTVFVIDDATPSAAPVPLVKTMARQQYAAL